MERITDYDKYLSTRRDKLERRLSIYLPVLEKKGFVVSVNSWWQTVTEIEPVWLEEEEEDTEELVSEQQTEYFNYPGIPSSGCLSVSVRHKLEDDDDAITYVIPVCTECGGEGEQSDLGHEQIDAMFKEIAKIARKGKLGYAHIKRAHIKEVMRNLLEKSNKPLKTGVIVTICIVGALLVGAAIAMIIVF